MISFITLLQEHPAIGFLLGLIFFAFMFSIKNVVIWLYSRQLEKEKQQQAQASRDSEAQD